MIDFDIDGVSYRAGKLDVFTQFHVSRRLSPFLGALIEVLGKRDQLAGAVIDVLKPVADALVAMPDDDCEYILFECLKVVQRRQDQAYTPVYLSGRRLQFDDIDLGVMLQITAQVIQANLGPFIAGLSGRLQGRPSA